MSARGARTPGSSSRSASRSRSRSSQSTRSRSAPTRRLPDHLRSGLAVVFVGINPGVRSSETGHHYAGHSNRFWKLLYESGLVPEPLTYEEDGRLPEWGYGLTNIVARPTPGVSDLTSADFERGRRTLVTKLQRLQPRVVALVGVTVYDRLFPGTRARAARRNAPGATRRAQRTGLRDDRLGPSDVFVLPNTSGRNAHYSYAQMLAVFRKLRSYLVREGVCVSLPRRSRPGARKR